MLIEMVKLRQSGRKCSSEEVHARVPVRGQLSIYMKRETLMASVLPEKPQPYDIPFLEEPRITRLRGDSFVLVGYEQVNARRAGARHPQAWWCRLPGGPARPNLPLDATLGREERRVARAERG